MKLNHDALWTITDIELRILTAVEVASKNHEIVPIELVKKISKLSINFDKYLISLCKSKFLRYEAVPYVGYRLTTSGYDCLAMNTLRKRGLKIMGNKIGIGKESDIFYGEYQGEKVILKYHRIGRTSFRTVKNKRDYHEDKKYASWLYLSRISAQKEVEFLSIFQEKINVPKVFDYNRHVIVMEYFEDFIPLYLAKNVDFDKVYCELMNNIEIMYNMGYVHGDFNEFNILINDQSDVKIIDFPQCVDLKNSKSQHYLIHDINCIKTFFEKKFKYTNDYVPDIPQIYLDGEL
ncbi:Atypical/RIO/RIO2 protein kinase [Edhazardia aedis USNM 41457]|uniref:non-specific serine/threonine protein kinase n=1 Tax=Edhazardia aedis (strain USNM 41457) TaxID=1003232 RepID=J9DGY8_EDHAE|nr:Atypical/RIO/RIO2 protein kinase [Edhazardia aedis USNM 41457]|eukprot:EJW01870.1 Atypical/RIO/RIO2 protein kinase [Edhazardia aedis USNM 41457]